MKYDSIDTIPRLTPIWCVYGPDCDPTIICCILKDYEKNDLMPGHSAIWGYSVYENVPGFRTKGQELISWLTCEFTHTAHFFSTKEEALAHIDVLISPAFSALVKINPTYAENLVGKKFVLRHNPTDGTVTEVMTYADGYFMIRPWCGDKPGVPRVVAADEIQKHYVELLSHV